MDITAIIIINITILICINRIIVIICAMLTFANISVYNHNNNNDATDTNYNNYYMVDNKYTSVCRLLQSSVFSVSLSVS